MTESLVTPARISYFYNIGVWSYLTPSFPLSTKKMLDDPTSIIWLLNKNKHCEYPLDLTFLAERIVGP
jgi:hypothetical protein